MDDVCCWPNQTWMMSVDPEPVLVDEDEDEDPEECEYEEEEDPQEEEDDMEVAIEEDENEPELTYPYEEMDSLNPPPRASESEPNDEIEIGESSTAAIPREDGDSLLPGFMRRDIDSLFGRMVNFSRRLYRREMAHALVEKKGKGKEKFYGKLILDLGNEVRSSVEQGTAAMEKLVEKLGNTEDKVECKKLKKELKESRIMPLKFAPLTQVAIRRMIKESVDAAIAAERARHANAGNDARGSGPARGQDVAPVIRECTFAGFMKCNPTAFHGTKGAVELLRWFEKTESVFRISECVESKKVNFATATLQELSLTWWNAEVATMGLETVNQMPWTEMKQLMTAEFSPIEEVQRMEHELWNLKVKEYNIVAYTQRFNELALMCPRMVKPERVKVDAYIQGLIDNIKGEVTSSKLANLNEAVRMAHKLMEQKLQARDERILKGKKRKWESFQSGNSSGKHECPRKVKQEEVGLARLRCERLSVTIAELLEKDLFVEFITGGETVLFVEKKQRWILWNVDRLSRVDQVDGSDSYSSSRIDDLFGPLQVQACILRSICDQLSPAMKKSLGRAFEDYFGVLKKEDCYASFQTNVVADALGRKERNRPLHGRALMMIVHNDLPKQIREA
ncbi:putative reverse transcriptase domain-containing protein [Tanacetum coccineum]